MQQPDAWKILGEQLHQDVVIIYGDLEAGMKCILGTLSALEREQIGRYLTYLIDSVEDDEARMVAWTSSGADLSPSVPQIRPFLIELLRMNREAAEQPGLPSS